MLCFNLRQERKKKPNLLVILGLLALPSQCSVNLSFLALMLSLLFPFSPGFHIKIHKTSHVIQCVHTFSLISLFLNVLHSVRRMFFVTLTWKCDGYFANSESLTQTAICEAMNKTNRRRIFLSCSKKKKSKRKKKYIYVIISLIPLWITVRRCWLQ